MLPTLYPTNATISPTVSPTNKTISPTLAPTNTSSPTFATTDIGGFPTVSPVTQVPSRSPFDVIIPKDTPSPVGVGDKRKNEEEEKQMSLLNYLLYGLCAAIVLN